MTASNPVCRRPGFARGKAARFLAIGYGQRLLWDSAARRLKHPLARLSVGVGK